ncbi:MAG: helix-turn-helix domain-containing protein, partial [Blastocatellia bacterium]
MQGQPINRNGPRHCGAVKAVARARFAAGRASAGQIAGIYEVDRDSVSNWLDRWDDDGIEGLHDQEGRGRKPILNE